MATEDPLEELSSSKESDSESDEGDEGEESEEEEEPKLKYQRLGASVPGILQNDSARCLLPHAKFLVLGTDKGKVHILDLNGNSIMTRRPHQAPINDMSLDEEGEFLATCSDDGTVVVLDIWSENSNRTKHSYHMPVWAVALPANYKSLQQFATGGTNAKFVINTKSRFLFTNRDNVIHSGEGPILAIKWQGDLLAWANPFGVKIYDIVAGDRVGFISRERQTGAGDPAHQTCCLCWKDAETLFIGWGDSVKIAMVRWRAGMSGGVGGAAGNRFVQLMSMFKMEDAIISGVAPFGGMLALLTTHISGTKGEEKTVEFDKPELRVMSWDAFDVSSDALPIYGHQYYKPTDYSLSFLAGADPIYYIVSPKDIVMARPCDVDDHLRWLLDRSKYAEALECAEKNVKMLRQHKLLDVGEKYLQSLMEEGKYEKAAAECERLLHGNGRLWETWISCFAQYEQLQAIAPYIPTPPDNPQLGEPWYEMVLNFLVSNDPPNFLQRIREWPTEIYSSEKVIKRVVTHLEEQKDLISPARVANGMRASVELSGQEQLMEGEEDLLEALCHLYIKGNKYDKAVHVLLKLGKEDVFDMMLKTPNLFDAVRDEVATLMQFRPEKAIDLFLNTSQVFSMDEVVEQLMDHPNLLHQYLDAVFQKDSMAGAKHHPKQVALYAEYEPEKLFHFLKTSNRYDLENSLKICRKKSMYPEEAYILEKMGDLKAALTIIVDKLANVPKAIEFVEENPDEALWEELINQTLHEPKYLTDLLDNVGSHVVDMPKLIRRIGDDMEIEGMRQKLQKILSEQILQVSVRKGCNQILETDSMQLWRKLHQISRRAVTVDTTQKCNICDNGVFGGRGRGERYVVFNCTHVYHETCLKSRGDIHTCSRCGEINRTQRRRTQRKGR